MALSQAHQWLSCCKLQALRQVLQPGQAPDPAQPQEPESRPIVSAEGHTLFRLRHVFLVMKHSVKNGGDVRHSSLLPPFKQHDRHSPVSNSAFAGVVGSSTTRQSTQEGARLPVRQQGAADLGPGGGARGAGEPAQTSLSLWLEGKVTGQC